MVSEPLFWHFLSSLVFIGVTPFSTSLSPSQQSPQPITIEPPTSSSRCLWVPNLQPLSLRSPTPHKPLHLSSPSWILLWLHFCRYHWDRLASIYTTVEASQSSETTCTLTCRPKLLHQNPHTTRTPHAVLNCSWLHPWCHQCHISPSLH